MSNGVDFLGFALAQIENQRQQRAARVEQAQRAQSMQMDQQRFQAQMHAADEAEKQDTLKLAVELAAQGYEAKSIFGLIGDKLPEAYRPFITEAVKREKQKAEIPSEAAQADTATGAAAMMGQQQGDPLRAALAGLRAIPGGGTPEYQNAMAARVGGIAAENQRQQQLFVDRTRLGTNENLRQFTGQQSYQNARDNVSLFVPPQAAGLAKKYGVQPGLTNIVGREKANALITESGGLVRELPLSLTGGKLEDVGISVPAATRSLQLNALDSTNELLTRMDALGDSFDPRYTQFVGQAGANLQTFARKLGVQTSDEMRDFEAGYREFKRQSGEIVMKRLNIVAATTFADSLRQIVVGLNLTEDLTDDAWRLRYAKIHEELEYNRARLIYTLRTDSLASTEYEMRGGTFGQETLNKMYDKLPNKRLRYQMDKLQAQAYDDARKAGASRDEARRISEVAVQRFFFTAPAGQPAAPAVP